MISLESNRLILRELTLDDVTDRYVSWLNDSKVNKFMESRFFKHELEDVRNFVISSNKDPCAILFGIFTKENMEHIGNIRIDIVSQLHKRASIGLLIGERNEWGKGYATEAIKTITKFSFNNLKIMKIFAGCSESNIGSKKAFEKSGYKVEGFFESHFKTREGREGGWMLGKVAD